MTLTTLLLNKQIVKLEAGELVSYHINHQQVIHQKGNPGWRNSDTEMFPIIGPTDKANFRVKTPKGEAVQDQHGLLRELSYELLEASETKAIFKKRYTAHAKIKNSKYPEKSSEPLLHWPYNFEFLKEFKLTEKGLKITFTISGEEGMPYMLGYHPAFNLVSTHPMLKAGDQRITLDSVLAVGSRALQVANTHEIILKDQQALKIITTGFHHFMLWTEVPNMVCIEPITFYPYDVRQDQLNEGFSFLTHEKAVFEVFLMHHEVFTV